MSGFRYASPTRSLTPVDPNGGRRFFVYDYNPYSEILDSLP